MCGGENAICVWGYLRCGSPDFCVPKVLCLLVLNSSTGLCFYLHFFALNTQNIPDLHAGTDLSDK